MELHNASIYGSVRMRKSLMISSNYSIDTNGVEHTESVPHSSDNKSSILINLYSPYFLSLVVFICGERQ